MVLMALLFSVAWSVAVRFAAAMTAIAVIGGLGSHVGLLQGLLVVFVMEATIERIMSKVVITVPLFMSTLPTMSRTAFCNSGISVCHSSRVCVPVDITRLMLGVCLPVNLVAVMVMPLPGSMPLVARTVQMCALLISREMAVV